MTRSSAVFVRVTLAFVLGLLPGTVSLHAADQSPASTLKIGLAQVTLRDSLDRSRDCILDMISRAASERCRVVVFPEGTLSGPDATTQQLDEALDLICSAARRLSIYAIVPGRYQRTPDEKTFNRLSIINPAGTVIQTYNKLWHDRRFPNAPGTFEIDGVTCATTICADRWLRSVQELPAFDGARILFECSNNYMNEWVPELQWYWQTPLALRTNAHVVVVNSVRPQGSTHEMGHGHSAFIAPDGRVTASLAAEPDRLLTREVEVADATLRETSRRRSNPVLRPFWSTGVELLHNQNVEAPASRHITGSGGSLNVALGQMECTSDLSANLARMEQMIRRATEAHADIVVFPELSLTGTSRQIIESISEERIAAGLKQLQTAAKSSRIVVVFGAPSLADGRRFNAAYVIGPEGDLLTEYRQIVVKENSPFSAGNDTHAMWFEIQGVPAIVTIGRDVLWNEIAELAAVRGAQLHCHLANDHDLSDEGRLRRDQLWVNIASFRGATLTINAARSTAGPESSASGQSKVWEDYRRWKSTTSKENWAHCALKLAEAGEAEQLLQATIVTEKSNPRFLTITRDCNSQMRPWWDIGVERIDARPGIEPAGDAGRRH